MHFSRNLQLDSKKALLNYQSQVIIEMCIYVVITKPRHNLFMKESTW